MAKRHKTNLITASFHYLIKIVRDYDDPANPREIGFSESEFQKIVTRISDERPLDENDPIIITRIKTGVDLPFSKYEEVDTALSFGDFEGAYYGQKYRNNVLGIVTAESLNLRPFNYLITLLRDGKILLGVTYNGQYGDYDGLKNCLTYLLKSNGCRIRSHSITSLSDELGEGTPTEIRLSYRNASDRPERRGIFSKTGVIAIKRADFGDDFPEQVAQIAKSIRGNDQDRKKTIGLIVKQGSMIDLDDEDIIGW